jgi:hypothetical protein
MPSIPPILSIPHAIPSLRAGRRVLRHLASSFSCSPSLAISRRFRGSRVTRGSGRRGPSWGLPLAPSAPVVPLAPLARGLPLPPLPLPPLPLPYLPRRGPRMLRTGGGGTTVGVGIGVGIGVGAGVGVGVGAGVGLIPGDTGSKLDCCRAGSAARARSCAASHSRRGTRRGAPIKGAAYSKISTSSSSSTFSVICGMKRIPIMRSSSGGVAASVSVRGFAPCTRGLTSLKHPIVRSIVTASYVVIEYG